MVKCMDIAKSVVQYTFHRIPFLHRYSTWLYGKFWLTALCHFPRRQVDRRRLVRLKQFHRITPELYTFEFFNQPNAVYWRVDHGRMFEHLYIGSTSTKVTVREDNRRRKHNALAAQKLVNAEPAIHYWHTTNTYWEFVPIKVRSVDDVAELHMIEQADIADLQPSLNAPFIYKHFKEDTGHTFQPKTICDVNVLATKLRARLHRHLGRKTRPWRAVKVQVDTKTRVWGLLTALCSTTALRWKTTRTLMSSNFPAENIYTLLRMTNILESPYKEFCKAALVKALDKRHMEIPNIRPLVTSLLPPMEECQRHLREVLRAIIASHYHELCPLHVPKTTVVAKPGSSIEAQCHNWQRMCFGPKLARRCTCPNPTQELSEHQVIDLQTAHASPEDPLHHIVTYSSKTGTFPEPDTWISQTTEDVRKWCRRNGLSIPSREAVQLALAPAARLSHNVKEQHVNHHMVKSLKTQYSDYIIACEDHHPHKMLAYCPLHFQQLMDKMYGDPEVFTKINITPTTAAHNAWHQLPQHIKTRYAWGINPNRKDKVPVSYIFPKRKKGFIKSRPIVSFAQHFAKKLFSTVAKIITNIMYISFPQALQQDNSYKIFKELHTFMNFNNADMHMQIADLAGFFTSVPQERILQALMITMNKYFANSQHGFDTWQDVSITYDPKKTLRTARTFNGKYKQINHGRRTIYMHDIWEITQYVLKCSYFTSQQQVYKQTRGSPMGHPMSPVLCHMVCCVEEHQWHETYRIALASCAILDRFTKRYVDDRICILPQSWAYTSPWGEFLQTEFYGPPILLEEQEEPNYLGCNIDLRRKEVRLILPSQTHQLLSPRGSTPIVHRASAYRTRRHMISKIAYPEPVRLQQLRELRALYQAHDPDMLTFVHR